MLHSLRLPQPQSPQHLLWKDHQQRPFPHGNGAFRPFEFIADAQGKSIVQHGIGELIFQAMQMDSLTFFRVRKDGYKPGLSSGYRQLG